MHYEALHLNFTAAINILIKTEGAWAIEITLHFMMMVDRPAQSKKGSLP